MKLEIGTKRPDHFKESWEGEYEIFSHLEFACGIPQILTAITTLKENGKPNLCFHAWSCFQGDKEGYFAILAGMNKGQHTYANIERTGDFCVNFLSMQYYDRLMETIKNGKDVDEFALGGFTTEPSVTVSSPRIKESFLTLECSKENIYNLTSTGSSNLIIGRVQNIAVEEEYAKGIDRKYSEDGFMFNVHSPKNCFTGEDDSTGIATLQVSRRS
jgi:flavin reductase (DIM6/NTAB) family NADH-FMN oxidoreductase RutF